ncbi:MAG: imelysin family protein [Gammaproteobacteria bacterium]
MKLTLLASATLSASLLLAGCNGSDDQTNEIHDLDKMKQVLETNADIAYATYSDSVTTAQQLKTAIETLTADQDQSALDAAKNAWLVAREPYSQTEVYRFRDSPIDDDPATTDAEDGPEGDINAWPLGEALIDYVTTGIDFGDDQVGVTSHSTGVADPIPSNNIIASTAITIDASLLANTATADDEHDVIAGYHAIEFLLWGQDLNQDGSADTVNSREANSPYGAPSSGGHRPLTDFQTGGFCTSGTGNPQADIICTRRHMYLTVAVDKLIADLIAVRDAWAPAAGYRTSFTTINTIDEGKGRLLKILTGMGTLSEGELAGERMQISLSANSQEDEHSCFSDNTHRDIWLNAKGVSNSYYGTYAGYNSTPATDTTDDVTTNAVNGYGLDDYLADIKQSNLAADVAAALTVTETNYTAIDAKARAGMPIDVLIMDPNSIDAKPVRDTILSLNAQSVQIAKIATELDLGSANDVVDPGASGCDTSNPTSSC